MDKSVGSTIEKIKREEQNKEVKLKAKRELEAAKVAVDRSIRDVLSLIKKLQQDNVDLIKKTDDLRGQVTIQRIRRDVLVLQLHSSNNELNELKNKSDQINLDLQKLRTTYCKVVHEVSDECDVWALLSKPFTEPLPRTTVTKPSESEINEQSLVNQRRLKSAKERRERALAERDRLKSEPDTGEEFIRIKNALRYSLEMTANLRK